ncbi:MAG: response regulator [Deltaproteobacteria bacterium]|nr:response regulator [Deltaproteobacteria bacterium]
MLRVPTNLTVSVPLLMKAHRNLPVDGRAPFVLTADVHLAKRLVDDLTCLGMRPVHLADHESVLTAWMETRPPLLLVDIRTPSNLAFSADLKLQPYLRDLPLVAVVPDATSATRNALRDAGVDDWLLTPWTLSELAARVRGNSLQPIGRSGREAGESHPAARVRILVVDDDPFVQQILEHQFRRRSWEVVRLEDAVEAFDRVRTDPFDIVVADALVPPSGVFELLCNLRTLHPAPAPRVLVTGAQDPEATCVRALGWGADDFVAKPLNPAVLAARVGRLVDRP